MSTPTSHVTYHHPQHGTPALTIDGTDVGHAIEAGFTINVPDPGGPASVSVRVAADEFTFDGDATVTVGVPKAVRAALTAAGWTPPEGTHHGLRLEVVVDAEPACCSPWLRLVGRNGETLMFSEDYATRSNARRAAKALAAKLGVTDVREVTA